MIYVHIPFCRRKCLYCDFYSVGERLADWPALVESLLTEADARFASATQDPASLSASPSTIYIGGGTPSLLPPSEFRRLADGLLGLRGVPDEFTIEVNPDDVTPDLAHLWHDCGVNRVSMGVQSLCDAELRAVGRRHTADDAMRAYGALRRVFDNVSLDLMFGLPGQSLDSLDATLRGFVQMDPEHVSAYSLMYEERTALTRLRDDGKLHETSDVDSATMFDLVSSLLASHGYEQYEISNYAKPGRRSLHNSAYWCGCAYIGLGPGAHSYDGGRVRSYNEPDVKAYVAARGNAKVVHEHLSDAELCEEYKMTRMRTREGIDLIDFEDRFGSAELEALLRAANKFAEVGLVEITDSKLVLTHSGIMVSDEVIIGLF